MLVRCLLVLVVTISDDSSVTLSILTWFCLILIPLVALLQVYKSFLLNVLEITYLSSILAMVFFFTTPYDVQLYLIVAIQVLLFIAIILFHVYQRLKLICPATFMRRKYIDARKIVHVQVHVDSEKEDEKNTRKVTHVSHTHVKFDELREPLLEEQTDS